MRHSHNGDYRGHQSVNLAVTRGNCSCSIRALAPRNCPLSCSFVCADCKMEAHRKYPAANEWVHFLLERDRNKTDACWVQEGILWVPEGNGETRKWPSFYPSNGWKFLKAFGTRHTSEWVLLLNCERKDRQSWLQNLALCVSHRCSSLKALSTPITQLCVEDHKRQYPLPPPWPTFCQLAGVFSCIMFAPAYCDLPNCRRLWLQKLAGPAAPCGLSFLLYCPL